MSSLLILTAEKVRQLLPVEHCIDVMQQVLSDLARGEAFQPLRSLVRAPGEKGFLGLMPAHHRKGEIGYGLKAVAVFPENPSRGLDTHLGAVLLYDADTGQLRAVIDAAAVTQIRTAAVSAVATRALSRWESRELAILGSGVQARAHLRSMLAVRAFCRVRIYSTNPESAREMAREAAGLNLDSIEAVTTAESAVRGADVIVTATSSPAPVLKLSWLKEGAHLNAVGSSIRAHREIDGETIAASALFVDRMESALNESGDYLLALEEGAISPGHIRGELGDVLLGKLEGRQSDTQLTMFKSLGLAVEDLAAGEFLFQKCLQSGEGTWVEGW